MDPEGELRLARRVGQREGVDLVATADAPGVDDGLAVGRDARIGVVEGVLGQVGGGARLDVDLVDVRDAAADGRDQHVATVGQQAWSLGLIQIERDLAYDLARQRREQEQHAALAAAGHEGHHVTVGREVERAARHEVVREVDVLVLPGEAGRQVLDQLAVSRGEQHDVDLALRAVAGVDGDQLARRARHEREDLGEGRLLLVRRQARPVVVGALLVAVGLEALLEPLVEGLVELAGRAAEGLLVDVVHAAAQHVLAQRVEELADALLAVAVLHELEGGVAHVVDEPAAEGGELGPRQRRDLVRDRGVTDLHQVQGVPGPAHVDRRGPRRSTAGPCAGSGFSGSGRTRRCG